jgi:hypothetical protein
MVRPAHIDDARRFMRDLGLSPVGRPRHQLA